jgi:hypothetical protein
MDGVSIKCNVLQSSFSLVLSHHKLMSQRCKKIAMFHSYVLFFSNLSSNLPLFALDSGKARILMKRSESGTRT